MGLARAVNATMHSMKTHHIIIASFILGIILTVFSYQAYAVYQLRSIVAEDHATLTQVVGFINTQIQASNPGAKAGTQPAAK